jgi:hypothetical protein
MGIQAAHGSRRWHRLCIFTFSSLGSFGVIFDSPVKILNPVAINFP